MRDTGGRRGVRSPAAATVLAKRECHWIGAGRGNEVSHTPKLRADDRLDPLGFRRILLAHQPGIGCRVVLPVRTKDAAPGYEHLPDEKVGGTRFATNLAGTATPACTSR